MLPVYDLHSTFDPYYLATDCVIQMIIRSCRTVHPTCTNCLQCWLVFFVVFFSGLRTRYLDSTNTMEEPGSCSVSYLGFSVITCSSWRITLLGFGLRQAAHPEGCGCHHWCTSHTGCTAAAGDWNGESAEEMRAARANRAAEEAHRKEFERASAAGELTEHQILAENERVRDLCKL